MLEKDIRALLAQGIGSTLHWFPADVSVYRLASVMVGLANGCGGRILIGIAPRSPQVQGIHDIEKALDTVLQAALLIDPPLVLPIPDTEVIDNRMIMVVSIPAGLPDVYNLEGRYLGREDSQTNPLPARKLRALLMERGALQFERQTHPEAALDDLDPDAVSEYIRWLGLPDTEPVEPLLLKRGCVRWRQEAETTRRRSAKRNAVDRADEISRVLRPTYAGLLMFAKEPQQWLPNATILMARFTSRSLSDRFAKKEARGALPDQLRQAEAFLRENISSQVRLVGLTHQEAPEYPFEVVRELLINAAAHRDYNNQGDNIHIHLFADRLEVISPGGLPGPVTLENLLEARFSRNAVLMQLLSDMGFGERMGYGLKRVVEALRRNGMRQPVFEETGGVFRVTIFRAVEEDSQERTLQTLKVLQDVTLNPRQEQAVSFLIRHRRITNRDYQDLCPEVHSETLRRDLVDLVERDILIKIGDKRATYYILKAG
ncbi:MAG: hypothetical protein B6D39_02200 [Anaerolineae bacterium UTCFX2]|jgi:ATP-dependent DNA helicase RecG|nr:putative DNA binding domain-containing protein [Anaerolineales bacterium]OQY94076.1 MAG: hypothetical protein B6D39_02200 [Anaerolineae bacterium UTCFX2]